MTKGANKKEINPKTTYKGQPLIRSGNTVYYGDPARPYIAMLQIITSKDKGGIELSDKIIVQIISTDDSLPMAARVAKKTEKNGLFNALAIAAIWLERQLKESE